MGTGGLGDVADLSNTQVTGRINGIRDNFNFMRSTRNLQVNQSEILQLRHVLHVKST